ncbi:dienelactone hydrolase family protein [Chryseobacterium koreense]|uniref:Dienelactone hydrolase n=1 Tax=Chryseobacterium koreense CCUG 49689 TaxID=1304281 RepID=A0A0J7IYA1_9FLAO|nr:dienelactone hydrolase family protein [Chryseobacterium koreense]KMQ71228.1 dienelactone hydrolase [Chryseobacterium koreense CCUG 49689]MBB5332639.1 dienelactone hydrolase [Chryseobacterium koreense]
MKLYPIFSMLCAVILFFSCADNKKTSEKNTEIAPSKNIKTEDVVYNIRGVNYKSFAAFPADSDQPKPVVMVIPEWWGLTDYAKNRAKQLAELGYFAMAVDFYGEGKVVDNPEEAGKLAQPFYQIPINAKMIFDAAKAHVVTFPNADNSKIAVIGYCFGGAQALNMARQESDLKGVVSFHGNLETGVRAKNNKVRILVCNGADDSFVSPAEIASFKKEMDSAKINYQFINYPNSLHSFTNPASTEMGKKFNLKIAYNKEADEKSWNDMKTFLADIFK